MDITLEQEGLAYIITCIRRYQGEGWFLLLFAMAETGMLFFYSQRKKREKLYSGRETDLTELLTGYLLLLSVSVFNIVPMQYVIRILSLEDEYYRFLWLLPTTVVTAYFCAKLADLTNRFLLKIGVAVMLAAIIVISGKTILARGFSLAENLYKIPDEVIQISEILHEDCQDEEPKVVADFDLLVYMNQYDPSIRLEISYGDISTLRDVEADVTGSDWDRWLTARLLVLQVLADYRLDISHWDFEAAMDYLDASYVIIAKDPEREAYLENARCREVQETEQYIVYRYYNSVLPIPEL